MVARVLFIWLTSWANTTTPRPAGDHKGPPNPSSSALAPTDHLASLPRAASRKTKHDLVTREPGLQAIK